MEPILDQIEGTFNAGFPFAAIHMALAIPDICATLELPLEGTTNGQIGKRYADWFDRYLSDKLPGLAGTDLWALRNGVLHQGIIGHPKMAYERVIFTIRPATGVMFHGNVVDGAYQIEVNQFLRDMIAAVRRWLADKVNDANVQGNMGHLVQIHPEGLAPYIKGVAVIA